MSQESDSPIEKFLCFTTVPFFTLTESQMELYLNVDKLLKLSTKLYPQV